MAFNHVWNRLTERLRHCLVAEEATTPHDIARFVRRRENVELVLTTCMKKYDADHVTTAELDDFEELVLSARRHVARARDGDAGPHDYALEAKRLRSEMDATAEAVEKWYVSASRGGTAEQRQLPLKKHVRARPTLRAGGKPGKREGTAEEQDRITRTKNIEHIVNHLLQLRPIPPAVQAAAEAGDARGLLALNAAGRRASTLRMRLRSWLAFTRWLKAAYGLAWPTDWRMLLEYVKVRVGEPCGKQTILSFYYSATFWERATGWTLTQDPLWKAGVGEMLAMVSGRAGHRESTTAPPPLLQHLRAYEKIAVNTDEPRWLRAYAAWKLCQAWGVLRFDDHRGMAPPEITVVN